MSPSYLGVVPNNPENIYSETKGMFLDYFIWKPIETSQ